VIAAVKDDGSRNLKYSAKRAFMNMGADNIWKLKYKNGWSFIGIKGMKKKGIDNSNKSASVN